MVTVIFQTTQLSSQIFLRRSLKQMVDQVVMTIKERESLLLQRISRIREVKFQSLEEQQQKIR